MEANQLQLAGELIKLSKEIHRAGEFRKEGVSFISTYKKVCRSHSDLDVSSMTSAINQLLVDEELLRAKLKQHLSKLINDSLDKYAFNNVNLSQQEIQSGYVLLIEKKKLPVDLSKDTAEVKVLFLTGEHAGQVLDWNSIPQQLREEIYN